MRSLILNRMMIWGLILILIVSFSSYGHFSYQAGHRRGKFSSRITPKMAINRDFPGLRAFSANFVRDKIEECEIPHPMVTSAARFESSPF